MAGIGVAGAGEGVAASAMGRVVMDRTCGGCRFFRVTEQRDDSPIGECRLGKIIGVFRDTMHGCAAFARPGETPRVDAPARRRTPTRPPGGGRGLAAVEVDALNLETALRGVAEGMRLGEDVGVYVAAVLERVALDLLGAIGDVVVADKKKIVAVAHVERALETFEPAEWTTTFLKVARTGQQPEPLGAEETSV
jgi:hypothetical protein